MKGDVAFMATMIPDLDPRMIENDGESRVYGSLRRLPPDYTVLYSYKYKTHGFASDGPRPWEYEPRFGEADFIVVHPALGYMVIEVKQGKVGYGSGQWYEEKQGGHQPLSKDPIGQAQKAIFAIRDCYLEKAQVTYCPLRARYALWFPECTHVWGDLPSTIDPDSILLEPDLDRPEEAVVRAFAVHERRLEREATRILIHKVLSPSFRLFARLDEQIRVYDSLARRVLTDEQERILDETELDKEKVFFGAAGTGKTFLAMEKARRLAKEGKKVFLTCYNRNLATYMRSVVPPEVTCQSFLDYLRDVLVQHGEPLKEPAPGEDPSDFYRRVLPEKGFDYFAGASDGSGASHEDRFGSIIVDEGQDFDDSWLLCLQAMRRGDGEFYVFADPNQDLFGVNLDALRKLPMSKHRLTRNLRNSETISNWIGTFVKEGRLQPAIQGGLRVVYKGWDTYKEERQLVEDEAGRLVSQGIQPKRIVILSPNVLERSSLQGCTKIKEWPLMDFKEATGNAIRFATIRSFKGLEADVVFLIGLKEGKKTCTDADIYVGGSRARFLLYIFYDKAEPPKAMPGERVDGSASQPSNAR
jgi:hypothetical protein